jgi:hypothetical protein
MRNALLIAVIVAGAMLTPSNAWAQEKPSCPNDATRASQAIWPSGGVAKGKTVTGRHPCGRSMQCTGGSGSSGGGARRSCRWL